MDGRVWHTGQNKGVMGLVDSKTGDVVEIPLGPGSRPHGIIVDDASGTIAKVNTGAGTFVRDFIAMISSSLSHVSWKQ
jgi:virginiamycin B lyase